MGNKLYVKMGKVNKMENMYDLAREKSIEYEHEEMSMNPSHSQELESKYNRNSIYNGQIFYEQGIEIKSFIFLNYLHGIKTEEISMNFSIFILINKYASAKGASWSGHNHTYRSFGPRIAPSIDDEAEWEPTEIQLYPNINTAIHTLYNWHSTSQGKMNINFENHHDHTNIHILALKTLQAYFIGVNMPQNGVSSSGSNSSMNMMAKMKAKVKSPRGLTTSKSASFPKKKDRPTIVLNVFERLMTKKVQYLDGQTAFNLVIICQSTIDLGAYSRLETNGGDIYIRCKDLIASSNCTISGGDNGRIVFDVGNDIEMKSRVVIKGKSLKIMSENFSLGFGGSMEVNDDIEIDVRNGLSLFDNSIIKSKNIEFKYKHILQGNNCMIDGTQRVNKIEIGAEKIENENENDNDNDNDNNDISEELPPTQSTPQGSNDEKNELE